MARMVPLRSRMEPRDAEMVVLFICWPEARSFISSNWLMVRSYALANSARNDATPNTSSSARVRR